MDFTLSITLKILLCIFRFLANYFDIIQWILILIKLIILKAIRLYINDLWKLDTDTHSILFLGSQRVKRLLGSEALYVSVVQTDVANKSTVNLLFVKNKEYIWN